MIFLCLDADQFITIFGGLDKEMNYLNLNDHIEGSNKSSCKSSALKLVDIFLSRNPKLTAGDIVSLFVLIVINK